MSDWLTNLKPGDEVGVERKGGMGRGHSIGKVKRRTPAGRIVVSLPGYEMTFNADGWEPRRRGGFPAQIVPVTDEIRRELEAARLISTLRAVKWETVELGVLRRVVELVGGRDG